MNHPTHDPTWAILLIVLFQGLIYFYPAAFDVLGWIFLASVVGFTVFCAYAYLDDCLRQRRKRRLREQRLLGQHSSE